jgi:hypothetical protein
MSNCGIEFVKTTFNKARFWQELCQWSSTSLEGVDAQCHKIQKKKIIGQNLD